MSGVIIEEPQMSPGGLSVGEEGSIHEIIGRPVVTAKQMTVLVGNDPDRRRATLHLVMIAKKEPIAFQVIIESREDAEAIIASLRQEVEFAWGVGSAR